jgi:hypothetical protein
MEEIFFCCEIQWKSWKTNTPLQNLLFPKRRRFCSIVGYNREKSYNAEWYFDLKCLSLPPDETLAKISYLKIQINAWKVLKM